MPLRLEVKTKAERGYALLRDGALGPERTMEIDIDPAMSSAEAFRATALSCLRQIVANEPATCAGQAEALHQMRIGLRRLRAAHREWMRETLDLGLLPESELRARYAGQAEYEAVRRDPSSYPFDRIAAAADLANERAAANVPKLLALLKDDDAAVRYWAATGLGALGPESASSIETIQMATGDASPTVRVAAAGIRSIRS